MKINSKKAMLLFGAIVSGTLLKAQFNNPGNFGWWRSNVTGTTTARAIAVGNLATTPYPAAFQIHGDLMPTGNQTPEVFRTNAPTTGNTFWRMFQGGTTSDKERGQLFSEPGDPLVGPYHFNINSPNGFLRLHTQNVERARLNGNVTGTIGAFPNINRDGYMVLSGQPDAFTNVNSRAPFTRLHLVDQETGLLNPVVYAQQIGFRPWQRNGITFTGNSDQSYIGHRYAGNDNTDFVIQWSDNPNGSPWGTDRMKFVFTTQFSGAATEGAATVDGLEAMRFWPQNNTNVNVGIGNFAPITVGDPTERLDILTGRVRVRQLPDDPAANTFTKVLVVDDTPGSTERGVLKWRDISTFPTGGGGTTGCEWTMSTTAPNTVYTAWGPVNPNCPDETDKVGIGTTNPTGKLDVLANDANIQVAGRFFSTGTGANLVGLSGAAGIYSPTWSNSRLGVAAQAFNGQVTNYGISAGAEATLVGPTENISFNGVATIGAGQLATWNMGMRNRVQGPASNAYGVNNDVTGGVVNSFGSFNKATGGGQAGSFAYGSDNQALNAATNTGVRALASGAAGSTNYGLYAAASGGLSYAAYFNGDIYCNGTPFTPSGGMWSASDAALKTNQAPVVNATASLALLQPKTYDFLTAQYPTIDLPTGQQAGFYAQELEQVFPQLVKDVTIPAQFDPMGVQVSPAYDVKSINYTGLIPYLVAALQEQNTRIDQLQQQLDQCCNAGGGIGTPRSMDAGTASNGLARETDLRIIPNPVAASTQLRYTVATEGRVRLEVSDAMGRLIEVLEEGQRTAGEFTFQWNTSGLAPGTYYCTLLVNEEPLVKRAVKLNER